MNTDILEDLGLTPTEIKTYLVLLEQGSSSAGAILEKSRLPNSTVHRDLNALIEKGIVSFILEGKRKVYQATDPTRFITFIDEKKQRFEQLLPELRARQNRVSKKETATVYKSIRGIKEAYSIMITTAGKEYNTFGGGPITAHVMTLDWWLNLHARRIANKLPSRQIFDESVRSTGGNEISRKPYTHIRYLSKDFAQFQETVIVGDNVMIAVFGENPYSFLIQDPRVADSYRKYFELLWR